MYNDIIKLQTLTSETVNDEADRVPTYTSKEIFAEKKSVGMKETYEALSVGLKPEMVFEIADYLDYSNQQFLTYEEVAGVSVTYKVLRTYRKIPSTKLEITVTR